MLDMSWGEMMVIGAVALIAIGPKELPKVLRTTGNMIGKMKRMAFEFQGQFHDAMREAELHDLKDTAQNVQKDLQKGFDPIGTIRQELMAPLDPEKKGYGPPAPPQQGS